MLLHEAIDIPTEVRTGDLVFKLTDAHEHTDETLANYVVTDQLREAFDEAVGLIGAAVREHSSKAAYLSGSFGAGKSNFMGVLQLLIDAHPAALAKPELSQTVAAIAEWRDDRKFLTVPFHLVGAKSLESAIFGGYVAYVRKLHPDATMPEVFADEPLLVNADNLRSTMGDQVFLAGLGNDAGWGDMSGWTAERYDAARAAPVGDEERRLLVDALLGDGGHLSGFAGTAKANEAGYVDMDTGLAAISAHAAQLGYAGLILFLDELILWLIGQMANREFVSLEASKVTKLVEGSEASRPVPIISFIARQRDLRDLVGHDVPGADKLSFVDQLDYMAERFADIRLNDSNLPVVAKERLLKPKDEAGAAALEQAFAGLHLSDDVRDALRGDSGTDRDFRLTYPFSPAFLAVVVDVASALQRTRTGLRVLLELLVANRDTLELGQLVPVGDLYDVLAEGTSPLSEEMKGSFVAARRIYADTLRPILASEHGLGPDDAPTEAFRNDDRLVKTLLLAALVPNSAPFRNLTARKLVALNHGLISSPVPGAEVSVVVNKLKSWAARAGELQLGDDPQNPTARIVLSEVDTRAILNSLASIDNIGSRRRLLRDLVAGALGVPIDRLTMETTVTWKGIKRPVDVVFGNIRDADLLTDSDFASNGETWKVVIDYPFDDQGWDPRSDLARIDALRAKGNNWRTVCWVPSFFTAEMMSQVGDLVRLNHILPVAGQVSQRFREATASLSPEAREQARPQLEAQQNAARSRLMNALGQAYGVITADPATIDTSHGLAEHFPSLRTGLTLRAPQGDANLLDAFEKMVTQALGHSYPAAPDLEGDVGNAALRRVLAVCEEAIEAVDRRVPQVPAAERRTMRSIANPLKLGVQSEQAFTLDVGRWANAFTRKLAERSAAGVAGEVTVKELRAWIDDPEPMGLTRQLENLVLIVWAGATDRSFRDHGGPAAVKLDSLGDHLEVVAERLPDADGWAAARIRAERVLGVPGLPDQPSAVGLARLGRAVRDAVQDYGDPASRAVQALDQLAALVSEDEPARLRTARVAEALIAGLGRASGDLGVADVLVDAELSPSAEAVAASLKAARATIGAIDGVDLGILGAAFAHADGVAVRDELAALLSADELAIKLAPELSTIYQRARALVFGQVAGPDVAASAAAPATASPAAAARYPAPSIAAAEQLPGTTGAAAVPAAASTSTVLGRRGLGRAEVQAALGQLIADLDAARYAEGRFDVEVVMRDGDDTGDGGG